MNQRGRKSGAALEMVGRQLVTATERPDPPQELTEEQAQEWSEVINRLPADWFHRENFSLLAQYCRHVVAARRVGQLVDDYGKNEAFDIADYDRLLKMQEREGRALSSLATRMRISQQSTYDAKKGKTRKGEGTRPPWEQ